MLPGPVFEITNRDIEGRTNREKVAQFNALRKHEESCMGGNQDKKEKLMS